MPISDQTLVNSYTGNGSTVVFAYTFKIFAQTDLKVTVDGVLKTLTTDYSVSGVGASGGGSITFVTAPANGLTVILYRSMTCERTQDYIENGDLKADTLDADLDRAIALTQELKRERVRSIKGPIEDTTDLSFTDTAASRVNKVLAFDASGLPKPKSVTDISSVYTSIGAGLQLASGDLSVIRPVLVGTAGGTVDAITCTVSPAPASLTNGLKVLIEAGGANTSTTPTLNLNGLGAKTVVKGSDSALLANDIPGARYWAELAYDLTLDKWVLNNPSDAITLIEHNTDGTHIPVAASAHRNTAVQGIGAGVPTQVQFTAEDWDTHNYLDITVNNRFTPLKAGHYHVMVSGRLAGTINGTNFAVYVYKNGGLWRQKISKNTTGGSADIYAHLSCDVYLNGSTDHAEFYVYHNDSVTRNLSGNPDDTFFQIHQIK